jgi:PAS domain S-box-containing protein
MRKQNGNGLLEGVQEDAGRHRPLQSIAGANGSPVFYHSLIEHLPICIFRKDRENRFVYVNARFCRLKGLPAEKILGRTPSDISSTELATKAKDHHDVILNTGKSVELEETYPQPDGSKKYFQVVKSPVFGDDGSIIGSQGMLLDITGMKEAEARLEAAHRQLVETSRLAGMAEVATSVLHNVGNVLNSVNISGSLIGERLKKSKIGSLAKVAVLFQEHTADLPGFFANDPRGRQLPGYVTELSAHLAREQEEVLKELSSLSANIEHIKEIVTMQQSYARVAGVTESLPVAELVEDALRMNAAAMERHQVTVVQDYHATPLIDVDKHKVLQILVNLMRNAKYALDEAQRPDKRMIVRIESAAERVRISIIDNGIGVPQENLARIFQHGFTTRKDGHGFGLHSGAITAKEMGGSLTCHSDGKMTGARFTLELPVRPPKGKTP